LTIDLFLFLFIISLISVNPWNIWINGVGELRNIDGSGDAGVGVYFSIRQLICFLFIVNWTLFVNSLVHFLRCQLRDK